MNKFKVVIIFPLIVAAGAALVFFRVENTEESVTDASLQLSEKIESDSLSISTSADANKDQELARLQSEMAALKGELEVLARNVAQTQQRGAGVHSPIEKEELVDDTTVDAGSESSSAQQHEEQMASLSMRLLSEPVDREWADETISAIETAMESNVELAGIELIQTTCMSTLCKLEVNIDKSSRTVEEAMQRLSIHRTWQGPTTFAVNSSGYAQIIFARDGHSLTESSVERDL